MTNKKLELASPQMSSEGYEQKFIKEAFDTNWIAPLGHNVNMFEKEMAEKLGVKKATALSCGTAAIHMSLKAAGVKAGEIVFCQSLTFAATANPIMYIGAKPVFIDSEPDTWMMSPEALERAFEKYPDTKYVVVVHLYGLPAKIDEISKICKNHNAVLIEDAAESLGSKYKGRYTGTFGKYAAISFNGNKIITTSGGGMLLYNFDEFEERAAKVLFWATQSREPRRYYYHKEIGYNYRMSNILAGIGRGQLMVLDERVAKKQYIARFYENLFKNLDGIELKAVPDGCECNRWLSVAQITRKDIKPIDLILAFEKDNIDSRHIWRPLHMQPVFEDCDYFDNGKVAEKIFESGICLPSDTNFTDEDLERIAGVIKNLWQKFDN